MAKLKTANNLFNGTQKGLLAVMAIGIVAAIVLAVLLLTTAKQNQSVMKAVIVALEKQTEMMATMHGSVSSEDFAKKIRSQMEEARRSEMLKPYKAVLGSYANAKRTGERRARH